MTEYIKRQDSLNTGREKINQALTKANTNADKAKIDSAEALFKAIASMNLSESLREQFNQIIIDGDSSVEAAAARVDEENITHDTLKERIDDGFTKTKTQLADTEQEVLKKVNKEDRNELKSTFRVATFNVRDSDKKYFETVDFLMNNNVDFVGLQEIYNLKEAEHNTPLFERYMGKKYVDYYYQKTKDNSPTKEQGNMVLSKYPLEGSEKHIYQISNMEDRGHIHTNVLVDGKKVSFYNTHIEQHQPWATQQINELFDVVSNDDSEYKIIVGDFNVEMEDLQIFIDAGYISAQGYEDNYYNTYDSGKAIDHIFATPNVDIKGVEMINSGSLSDHHMLVMDIQIDNDLGKLRDEINTSSQNILSYIHELSMVIDINENENGGYIRFKSGLMVCYSKNLVLDRVMSGGAYLDVYWYYPYRFISEPTVLATPQYTKNAIGARLWGSLITGFEGDSGFRRSHIRLYSATNSEWLAGHKVPVNAVAFGKWK